MCQCHSIILKVKVVLFSPSHVFSLCTSLLSTAFSSVLHNKNYSTRLFYLTLSKTDGNVWSKITITENSKRQRKKDSAKKVIGKLKKENFAHQRLPVEYQVESRRVHTCMCGILMTYLCESCNVFKSRYASFLYI